MRRDFSLGIILELPSTLINFISCLSALRTAHPSFRHGLSKVPKIFTLCPLTRRQIRQATCWRATATWRSWATCRTSGQWGPCFRDAVVCSTRISAMTICAQSAETGILYTGPGPITPGIFAFYYVIKQRFIRHRGCIRVRRGDVVFIGSIKCFNVVRPEEIALWSGFLCGRNSIAQFCQAAVAETTVRIGEGLSLFVSGMVTLVIPLEISVKSTCYTSKPTGTRQSVSTLLCYS